MIFGGKLKRKKSGNSSWLLFNMYLVLVYAMHFAKCFELCCFMYYSQHFRVSVVIVPHTNEESEA